MRAAPPAAAMAPVSSPPAATAAPINIPLPPRRAPSVAPAATKTRQVSAVATAQATVATTATMAMAASRWRPGCYRRSRGGRARDQRCQGVAEGVLTTLGDRPGCRSPRTRKWCPGGR
jgi:hypothetical protein